MSYIRVGAPRNTSNGDYGRFHFIPNMSRNRNNMQSQQNSYFSTNGNSMVQHVHYPNCSNRQSANKFTDGEKEYTIEYGEDAVRAALGGSMPDFQAEFQKQYGGGVEMTGANGGEESENKGQINTGPVNNEVNIGNSTESSNSADQNTTEDIPVPAETLTSGEAPMQEINTPSTGVASKQEINAPSTGVASKQENIASAFESARRARSTGQVKYGRHVRPTYWKPETPNPCRKKKGNGGSGDVNEKEANFNKEQPGIPSTPYAYSEPDPNFNQMMYPNAYYAPSPVTPITTASQKNDTASVNQRAQSVPPRQGNRSVYSLCGKCKKCRNLRSEAPEASVMTFPKYSAGGFQRQSEKLTSSNLSQSAKNFRAIRFSSHHNM